MPKINPYLNFDTFRKTFITTLNLYNTRIREEMLQFSLDFNSSHIDLVYEMLFEKYLPAIAEFRKYFNHIND